MGRSSANAGSRAADARFEVSARAATSALARRLLVFAAVRTRGEHVQLGILGEEAACRELTRRGYAILARRFRTRHGEIDIIARHGAALVFIEVKARRSLRRGGPADAVDYRKQLRLERMALCYLSACGLAGAACRFDVVSVLYAADASAPVIEVIENAFDVA